MIFKLACGDIMPGCSTRFENTSRTDLIDDVGQHAEAVHGLTSITPDILTAIDRSIRTAAS